MFYDGGFDWAGSALVLGQWLLLVVGLGFLATAFVASARRDYADARRRALIAAVALFVSVLLSPLWGKILW